MGKRVHRRSRRRWGYGPRVLVALCVLFALVGSARDGFAPASAQPTTTTTCDGPCAPTTTKPGRPTTTLCNPDQGGCRTTTTVKPCTSFTCLTLPTIPTTTTNPCRIYNCNTTVPLTTPPTRPAPTTSMSTTTSTSPTTPTTTVKTTATTKAPPTTTKTTTPPHLTATTSPPGTVAPTTTTTTSTTTPPTTLATTPPPATVAGSRFLALNHTSTPPGGPVTARGQGCDPDGTVDLSIGSTPVGSTVADSQGAFRAPLTASLPVGQYQVTAVCGPTLQATLDVVLTSNAGPPTSTAAILLILLLMLLLATRWQLSQR